jgi:dihydrofolate reductase
MSKLQNDTGFSAIPVNVSMSDGKISLNLATSLDGFIATEDGGVSWLEEFNEQTDDEEVMESFWEFFADIDCLVMGSQTYEPLLEAEEWPYGQKPIYVITRRDVSLVNEHVRLFDGEVNELAHELKQQHRHIWLVGGGQIAQSFLSSNQLDEIWLTIIPTLLGSGISLFDDSIGTHDLDLIESTSYTNGIVELRYRIDTN